MPSTPYHIHVVIFGKLDGIMPDYAWRVLYAWYRQMYVTMQPVFHGACFEADSAPILYAPYILYAPGKALPGAYKERTKSAPNPLQNTLHGKRALGYTEP